MLSGGKWGAGKKPSFDNSVTFSTAAYKHADGKKIDGRRIVVDVERGRTVKTWRPRRLGEASILNSCVNEQA